MTRSLDYIIRLYWPIWNSREES